MAKLTGYKRVAVVKRGCCSYHYALYDDDINVGDKVLVSGNNFNSPLVEVGEIITPEEAAERFKKNITAEVICKVDTSTYDMRVQKRKDAEKIKKEMDKKIREMQEKDKYSMYAERNSELAELLAAYNELTQ